MSEKAFTVEEIEERKKAVKHTMRCPYCDVKLTRWQVPDTPFNEWDAEYVYVCLNKRCPYNVKSFGVMRQQGNVGFCYRLMYHRERDHFYCVPDVGFGSVG
jgi:hypothetical protein